MGFRAVKASALGTGPWECRVEEGEAGPLFVVVEGGCGGEEELGGEGNGGGARTGRSCFSGPSPTRPWTDACLARATGQRISGPLFFGFSDPAVQAAVEGLYSPEELAAARRGEGGVMRRSREEVAGNANGGGGPSPSSAAANAISTSAASAASAAAERAALDLMARYGIGEATACVLAHTTALSGERFASADELEAWARGGGRGGGGGGGRGEGGRGGRKRGKEEEGERRRKAGGSWRRLCGNGGENDAKAAEEESCWLWCFCSCRCYSCSFCSCSRDEKFPKVKREQKSESESERERHF